MKNVKSPLLNCLFVLLIGLVGCSSNFKYKVDKNTNSITIHQDSTLIQIEIIDHAIIHVQKQLLGQAVSDLPDYVTVLEPQNVDWKLKETENYVSVSTDKLEVKFKSDGTIEYFTLGGDKLVAETNELSYIRSDTVYENSVSQAFVAGDEALYGLGQFQSGIMNWKNVSIRLQQFNQEIAIPFLVSTKGYGIYWHNYSLTDFNLPQDEILFATEGGVVSKKKEDEQADVEEKEDVASYLKVDKTKKDIREATFTPTKTGEYTFLAISDYEGRPRGEIMLSIDNDTIIDYHSVWVPRRYSAKKSLEVGKTYNVKFLNKGASIAGRLLYNEPDFNKTVFSSTKGNVIDYYLVHGENPQEVINQYQNLTGKANMFTKSAYGFWQCRERYHDQAELLQNANDMRDRKIPFDNIVQDWFYWPKGDKGPEWDRVKYPNPKAMVDELKELNLKLMVSVWPSISNEGVIEKYGLTLLEESTYIDIYDLKNREGFYKALSDSMFNIGVNTIWLDGSEPEGVKNFDINTAVGHYENVQNPYSLEVTRAVYEGRREEYPNERVFNLTRSAYAGQQRYGAASWSGDVEATWRQLGEQIAAGLNFTMAGIPYWTHDIGGFFRDKKGLNPLFDNQYTNPEYIELLTRWFQFGTFSPIFRIHGYKSETEIWRYGQEFEAMARKFIDVRYQLMPYIYSEAWKVTNNGQLLMSPMAYYYPNDKNTWGIKDQLFFGESIMVSFVTDYKQRTKTVYLPEGDWFNFWTDEKVAGNGEIEVKTPLDEVPMFVKEGSILPIGPKVQYTTQPTDELTRLKVYPGKDAEYVLYMDDNESYDYEKGEYAEIIITYSEINKKVILKNGKGNFINFEQNPMGFIIEMVGAEKEEKVKFKGEEILVNL